jgi:tight adherence protein C
MIEAVNAFLTGSLGPFGPLIAVGVLGILLIVLTLPALLRKQKDPLDKLRETAKGGTGKKDNKAALRSNSKNVKLDKYSTFLEPQDEKEYSAVRLKLMQAGYRSKDAVRTYHFMQFALGLGLMFFGLVLVVLKSATGDPSTTSLILTALLPGVIGYMAPKYWVTRRQGERKQEITNGFPDALDMMLVCVEAGQSLDQSIIRVSKEIRAGFPALADEFEIVSLELKAGKDKTQVLRDMAERAGVTDVSSFVTVMIQSAAFGTSIAEALRVYASEMRDKRVMRAEEKANTLPTKMTLATMMLTVPPLLIILIGPSVYEIVQTLKAANF